MNQKKPYNKFKLLIIAFSVGLLSLLLVNLIAYNSFTQSEQEEVLNTTKDYIGFQEQTTGLINSTILLFNGYSAYVNSQAEMISEETTKLYLASLTKDYAAYIRNIGIMKDTTIIYTFPKNGNESTIGVDLATIEDQKEFVLRTKKLLSPFFQGPINILQGDEAFIVRVPLLDYNNEYWGQISVVLKAEVILREIENYADEHELQVYIVDGNLGTSIYGSEKILKQNPLEYKIQNNLLDWKVYVLPKEGWIDRTRSKIMIILLSLLCFSFFSGLTYILLKSNYEVKYNSSHDYLTGLYNRHFFDDYNSILMANASRNEMSFGLCLIDLDKFKSINDSYGHKIGDIVLVETSRVLRTISRENEPVFRLGGDEFLIIIPKLITKDELEVIKSRIEEAFLIDFHVKDYDINMTASVGTAIYPEDGYTVSEVLHKADKRMYEEKVLMKTTDVK